MSRDLGSLASACVGVSDLFAVTSIFLLMTVSRIEARKKSQLSIKFLVLFVADRALAAAGVLYPGSPQAVQALGALRASASGAGLGKGPLESAKAVLILARSSPHIYECLFMSFALVASICILISDLVARVTARMSNYDAELKETDKQIAEAEARLAAKKRQRKEDAAKAKSPRKKKDRGTSKKSDDKSTSAAASSAESGSNEVKEKLVPQASASLNAFCFAASIAALIVTGLALTKLPKGSRPSTPMDVLRLLPKCLPARHGLVSLLTWVSVARNRRLWLQRDSDSGALRISGAGQAALMQSVALTAFMLAWVLDAADGSPRASIDNRHNTNVGAGVPNLPSPDMLLTYIQRSSPVTQAHMVVVVLELVIILIGFVPTYITLNPAACGLISSLLPIALSALTHPDFFGFKGGLIGVSQAISTLTLMTQGMTLIFGGPLSVASTVVVFSLLSRAHAGTII